jgi:hypothetical protein
MLAAYGDHACSCLAERVRVLGWHLYVTGVLITVSFLSAGLGAAADYVEVRMRSAAGHTFLARMISPHCIVALGTQCQLVLAVNIRVLQLYEL